MKRAAGKARYEKIVTMIEESEKLKSSLEAKAENLADALVPYTLAGTAVTYVLTGNVTRALSVLMVDFSCALKLAMPIAVLSAMREASTCHITVKGGKYLEAASKADTIVFDKTGTLTKAKPQVAGILTFGGRDWKEMLRMAACLEEHYPHSMANTVVHEAKRHNLEHEEMHSRVDYIVAHGISSIVEGKKVIIGSFHFVFEDEKCRIPQGEQEKFESLPEDKAAFVESEKRKGRKVIMIGDGINDSSALSAADVGIAISDGAAIAREIADITISADSLRELVVLKDLSDRLMKRVHGNYQFVIGFNLGLIILGVTGILSPSASALLHNSSTLGISLKSMTNLIS